MLVRGRVNVEEAGTRFVASDVRLIEKIGHANGERTSNLVRVRVNLQAVDTGVLDRLQQVLGECPGRCRVAFDLLSDDGTMATLDAEKGIEPTPELLARVREICGADSVTLVAANGAMGVAVAAGSPF